MNPDFYILPAEYIGDAGHDENGFLNIGYGNNELKIHLTKGSLPGWFNSGTVPVYIRRSSIDMSIVEILIVRHDQLAHEELDFENEQAQIYPLGEKEYWRSKMVGKYKYGIDSHIMTNEDFEENWDKEGNK